VGTVTTTDRDLEIFRAWTAGERQWRIAERYGVDQSNVSRAIARARDVLPPLDRAEVLEQSVEMLNDLLTVYQPKALAGDKAAGRLVDRLLSLDSRCSN
jgi:hypothetical protein